METPEFIRNTYLANPNETSNERRKRLQNKRTAKFRYFKKFKQNCEGGVDIISLLSDEREAARNRQQVRRAKMSECRRVAELESSKKRQRDRRKRLTDAEKAVIREKHRLRQQKRRQNMTNEEKARSRDSDRVRIRHMRQKKNIYSEKHNAQDVDKGTTCARLSIETLSERKLLERQALNLSDYTYPSDSVSFCSMLTQSLFTLQTTEHMFIDTPPVRKNALISTLSDSQHIMSEVPDFIHAEKWLQPVFLGSSPGLPRQPFVANYDCELSDDNTVGMPLLSTVACPGISQSDISVPHPITGAVASRQDTSSNTFRRILPPLPEFLTNRGNNGSLTSSLY